MRKNILAMLVAAISMIGIAEARPVFITVLGTGVVQDTDRQSAVDQASDAAMGNANASCAGTIVKAVKAPPLCFGGSDDNPYTCTVIVTATCQIGN
jgi:hypothetical protein